MLKLGLPAQGLRVLCLGAHCDDIEIGAGGTLLRLLAAGQVQAVRWVVLAATSARAQEAEACAAQFLVAAPTPPQAEITVHRYPDGRLAQHYEAIKADFEALKDFAPNLILTHYQHDLHQDHRLVSELTWNTFRNHLIWEYEIPKYDGDLGNPACLVALTAAELARKVALLLAGYPSQAGKHWFDAETFGALARLRAMQAGGDCRYAEGFYVRKMLI
ncbi:PIG-L family deacetylase [Hymenobacter sp. H14-R3]|uniref:PIG-L deacetylase family protein n=1 Tax=Hymenobacter sp. H14-R3 TaxID=3046308 RepID=UPI0024BBE921|nr:PIG-L family deacetylase [Hymenobacter sp. H14-R3]MDJ0367177.1 PIG-L family deacetylase [Hymenobacter sp. H14-R3]